MDRNDRRAIENLFEKLAEVQEHAQPRDEEAEAFIREQIVRQPGAPYYMAQTIVMQEQALAAAQSRIEKLEREAASGRSSGSGLFSGIFGDPPPRSAHSTPRAARGPSPWGGSAEPRAQYRRGGGGFLAGAAQTAMGVAGGVLLGNAIAGMFDGDVAEAAEADVEDPGLEDAALEDPGLEDSGFDEGGDMEL